MAERVEAIREEESGVSERGERHMLPLPLAYSY